MSDKYEGAGPTPLALWRWGMECPCGEFTAIELCPKCYSRFLRGRIQELEHEVARLRGALEKYGRHLPDCKCIGAVYQGKRLLVEISKRCTCGLEQALEKRYEKRK